VFGVLVFVCCEQKQQQTAAAAAARQQKQHGTVAMSAAGAKPSDRNMSNWPT
jgi:hypothetical protein